jgi:hypothetical protein
VNSNGCDWFFPGNCNTAVVSGGCTLYGKNVCENNDNKLNCGWKEGSGGGCKRKCFNYTEPNCPSDGFSSDYGEDCVIISSVCQSIDSVSCEYYVLKDLCINPLVTQGRCDWFNNGGCKNIVREGGCSSLGKLTCVDENNNNNCDWREDGGCLRRCLNYTTPDYCGTVSAVDGLCIYINNTYINGGKCYAKDGLECSDYLTAQECIDDNIVGNDNVGCDWYFGKGCDRKKKDGNGECSVVGKSVCEDTDNKNNCGWKDFGGCRSRCSNFSSESNCKKIKGYDGLCVFIKDLSGNGGKCIADVSIDSCNFYENPEQCISDSSHDLDGKCDLFLNSGGSGFFCRSKITSDSCQSLGKSGCIKSANCFWKESSGCSDAEKCDDINNRNYCLGFSKESCFWNITTDMCGDLRCNNVLVRGASSPSEKGETCLEKGCVFMDGISCSSECNLYFEASSTGYCNVKACSNIKPILDGSAYYPCGPNCYHNPFDNSCIKNCTLLSGLKKGGDGITCEREKSEDLEEDIKSEKENNSENMWWIILLIVSGVIALIMIGVIVFLIIKKKKKKK